MTNFEPKTEPTPVGAVDSIQTPTDIAGAHSSHNSLLDTAWSTGQSLGREAEFAFGSVAGAAKDALNGATAIDCAESVAIGFAFAALESRHCLPGLVKTATTALLAANVVGEVADYKKWSPTLTAAADAWQSGKNMDADISVGKKTLGHVVVGSAVLASGLLLGAKIGRMSMPDLSPFSSTQLLPLRSQSPTDSLFSPDKPTTTHDLPNLSQPQSGEPYRYFARSQGGATPDIYRWPANGKPLAAQNLIDVEHFDKSGTWRGNHREALVREWSKGWFDEGHDEISATRAKALMAKLPNIATS